MRKIIVGDEVVVITGKNKGTRGRVLSAVGEGKLVVAGINVVKRHVKANPAKGVTGGVIEKPMPIEISNVAIVNKESGRADRVAIAVDSSGGKFRAYRSNGQRVQS